MSAHIQSFILFGWLLLQLVATIDKRVQEGQINFPIDCPLEANNNLEYAQLWKINNSLFDLLDLPSLITPNVPYGITIETVLPSMNQVTYQCFVPVDGNGLNVQNGEIDTLVVTKKANYTPPNIKPEAKLIFDSLKFTFNAWPTNIKIAWKFENNQTCTPPVTFTIQQLVCDAPHLSWNTTDLEYSLPLSLFADDHNYLTLFASDNNGNECTRSQAKFQVFQNFTPEEMPVDLGDSSCLMIPTVPPKQILCAVWPDNNGNSCTCSLCHSNNNECALSDCPCYSESSFKPTLRIGQNNTYKPQLCLPKLYADRNNSNVHFYTEGIVNECGGKRLSSSFISQSLVSATTLLVRGPPLPPSIQVTTTDALRICFDTFSIYPVVYEFNVTDITGDVFSQTNCSEQCIVIENLACSPYNISVIAHNKVGGSNLTWSTTDAKEGGDYCSCVHSKSSVFFSETIGSNSADVNLTCKKTESFSQITTVILQLQPSKDNHYYNITCDGRCKDFHFSSLSEETKYRIQSVWESENATQYCQVMEFYTSSTKELQKYMYAIIAMGIVIILLVAILLVLIILLCCKKCHKNKKGYEELK